MGLANGTMLLNGSITALAIPLESWDNLDIFSLMMELTFLSMCGWFIARIVKGKGMSETGVQNEEHVTGLSGSFESPASSEEPQSPFAQDHIGESGYNDQGYYEGE